jgi:hypothetical protein
LPTTAEYRRYTVGVMTKVTSRDDVDLSPLDVHAHVDVPVREVSAFVNAELARAMRGPMQIIAQLLEYLDAYGAAGVTQQDWLQRAAADAELRHPEELVATAVPVVPAVPAAPRRRSLHLHGIRRR